MTLPVAHGPSTPATPVQVPSKLQARLDQLVAKNDLVLIMKGTPEQPMCGFSMRAAQVYQSLGRPFAHVNVFAEPDPLWFIRAVAAWADWPTLPQCWVKGQLIGGSDLALEMYQSGELQRLLGATS